MGPIWCRQDPGGPHVGPTNFAIWVVIDGFVCLQWYCPKERVRLILCMHYNEGHGVSNHGKLVCLFTSLLRLASKLTSNLHTTDPFWGESTSVFPTHMASNAESVSMSGRHHVFYSTRALDSAEAAQAGLTYTFQIPHPGVLILRIVRGCTTGKLKFRVHRWMIINAGNA